MKEMKGEGPLVPPEEEDLFLIAEALGVPVAIRIDYLAGVIRRPEGGIPEAIRFRGQDVALSDLRSAQDDGDAPGGLEKVLILKGEPLLGFMVSRVAGLREIGRAGVRPVEGSALSRSLPAVVSGLARAGPDFVYILDPGALKIFARGSARENRE